MRRTILFLTLLALVVSACGGDTAESGSPRPTTPGASVSGSTESSPSASTASVPVGTWTGKLIEPGVAVYEFQVTILPCALGEPCGKFRAATSDYRETGKAGSCGGTLTYSRTQDHAFVFQEMVVYNRGAFPGCANAAMFLTPMNKRTLRIKEYWEGGFNSHGTLQLADETR